MKVVVVLSRTQSEVEFEGEIKPSENAEGKLIIFDQSVAGGIKAVFATGEWIYWKAYN